jgi:tetratricopeptide (TPR) repeat protein
MTVAEHARFLDQANTGKVSGSYSSLLCSSSVESSECSRDSDRQSIHLAIQESVGFDHLNRAIVEVIEMWMFQQLSQQIETQDEEEINHPKAAMAAMLFDQGRYAEAIVLEEQILVYTKKMHPSGHAMIGIAMTNLAMSYRSIGRHHDALALCFEALSIYEQKLEPHHPFIGREYGNIGECYYSMRCPADCLRMQLRALQWCRQHLSPDDPQIGIALASVATAYDLSDDSELAVRWGQDAMEFQKRVLPPNHPNFAVTLSNLSIAYTKCSRHAEAISAIEEAVSLLKRVRAHNHPFLVQALIIQTSSHAAAAQYFASHS